MAAILGSALFAQTPPDAGAIRTFHVRENVWMLITPDGNLALQTGPDGVLLVDTGRAGTSDAVLAAIRRITTQPLRFIINTSAGPMSVGNNPVLGALKGGATDRKGVGVTPAIIAHGSVVGRMSAAKFPGVALPNDGYLLERRSIRFNGEAIDVIHQPSAYSEGDSIVYFRRSDIIFAGEIFSTKRFPRVDSEHGGTYQGILSALNQMLDLAVPAVVAESFAEDGTLISPGSGRLCDKDDLTEYRDMLHIVRGRMAKMVKQGSSLDAVKAAKLLVDYDQRYSVPEWTGAMFTDALYAEDVRSTGAASGKAVK
jgi:glyoxylase-like metal-dependent hydrolase (beta-lactamase superfamily II)